MSADTLWELLRMLAEDEYGWVREHAVSHPNYQA